MEQIYGERDFNLFWISKDNWELLSKLVKIWKRDNITLAMFLNTHYNMDIQIPNSPDEFPVSIWNVILIELGKLTLEPLDFSLSGVRDLVALKIGENLRRVINFKGDVIVLFYKNSLASMIGIENPLDSSISSIAYLLAETLDPKIPDGLATLVKLIDRHSKSKLGI